MRWIFVRNAVNFAVNFCKKCGEMWWNIYFHRIHRNHRISYKDSPQSPHFLQRFTAFTAFLTKIYPKNLDPGCLVNGLAPVIDNCQIIFGCPQDSSDISVSSYINQSHVDRKKEERRLNLKTQTTVVDNSIHTADQNQPQIGPTNLPTSSSANSAEHKTPPQLPEPDEEIEQITQYMKLIKKITKTFKMQKTIITNNYAYQHIYKLGSFPFVPPPPPPA